MSGAVEKDRSDTSGVVLEESLKSDLLSLKESILRVVSNFPEIRSPLHDSSRDVPKATEQLDKITEQTEEAANRVLELVEGIASSLSDIIGNTNKALNEIRDSSFAGENAVACLEKVDELANNCQNDSYTIMDALQFQDITAQQIDHAASLLEGVENKLTNIIGQLFKDDTSSPSDDAKGSVGQKKERAYNPDAHMTKLQSSQDEIDDLIKQNIEKKLEFSSNGEERNS